ncbi:AraC family transcriptional regulator [Klebsiella variicola]|nr:AraC family transcriptional regulator [Klebsiella variicola]
MADQVWLAGFWLNSGLQGEARANGKLDTSSLALHYLHGLPRPVYWVLWLWRRLRGEILFQDKNLLLLHHQGHYQLLLRNTVVYNPWLSSEAAFIQRFSQPYSVRLQGLEAAGASNSTCSISIMARYSRWSTPFAAAAAPTLRITSG